MEETIEEKAKRLGVDIIPPMPAHPFKSRESEEKKGWDEYKRKLIESLNVTVSICGGCGKEIKKYGVTHPCGNSSCPFGSFTYSSPL